MEKKRPPIVVIMGHVDHGKTTLLDHIRKTNVGAREAGGITQSIGAYEIEVRHDVEPKSRDSEANRGIPRDARDDFVGSHKITFIDTPGHEAFSCMREHGANVADLAILVIAADDSVKPQTKDALKCITDSKTPYIVAINKTDTPGANIEKVKSDLSQIGVYLEGYGGNISWHAISAKTGEGVNELLDLILLATDMENLTYNPEENGSGIVLTSRLEPRRGNIVGVIIKNGSLKKGKYIGTENSSGKIKILENFQGGPVENLEPSAPALVVGFERLPEIGEIFQTSDSPIETKKKATSQVSSTSKENLTKFVLKADESGSLEALKGVFEKISSSFPLLVIESGVGQVIENDVKTAFGTDAIVVAFRSKIDKAAENLGKSQKIKIIESNIIYELEKSVIEFLKKIQKQDVRALEVLALFGPRKGKQQIIGGKVVKGPIKNQESFEIWHENKQIGTGKILSLQSKKDNVQQAEEGNECGLSVETDEPIAIGHKLIFSNPQSLITNS